MVEFTKNTPEKYTGVLVIINHDMHETKGSS